MVGTRGKRAHAAATARATEAEAGSSKRRCRSAAAATSTTAEQKQPAAATAQPKAASRPASKQKSEAKTAAPAKKAASARSAGAAGGTVTVNRAPVLTLWVAVVAQRQGYSWQEGLTFGRWVSGVLAQSKGRALGLYEERQKSESEQREREQLDRQLGVQRLDCFGMQIPAALVGDERHAVSGGQPVDPDSVQSYLQRSFGTQLEAAKAAMENLATAIPEEHVGRVAYRLYERFRPAWKGWGAKSQLHLDTVTGLAQSWMEEEEEE